MSDSLLYHPMIKNKSILELVSMQVPAYGIMAWLEFAAITFILTTLGETK